MSEENVERLRGLYASMAHGEFGGHADLLSPDLVYEPVADGRESFHGVDTFARQFREFLQQWSEFTIEPLDFEDHGDTVLVTERQHGRGRASGIETEMTFFSAWTFREGLVVRARWGTSRADALDS